MNVSNSKKEINFGISTSINRLKSSKYQGRCIKLNKDILTLYDTTTNTKSKLYNL